MALSDREAVDRAQAIINGPRVAEQKRLKRIADAVRPASGSLPVMVPEDAPPQMHRLARKARTNHLPLILDVLSQTLIVEGYRMAKSDADAPAWRYWQANQLDARQVGLHRAALQYGVAYVVVLPGDSGPSIRAVSPRKMTALFDDPDEDQWPEMALREDARQVRLYDDEAVYYFKRDAATQALTFDRREDHVLGVCPVVRYRDRMLLDNNVQGLIEPLIEIQERVDETVFGLLQAQFFAATKQRYILGWTPQDEEERLKFGAATVVTIDKEPGKEVEAGEWAETDLTRFLESKDSAVGDIATISQVPKQNLGVGNIANLSAEALAAMEASKDRKVREVEMSLGESHEQALRLACLADGDESGSQDTSSQVRWTDATARSLAQTVDALGKMAQMLGVPQQALWERIPGVSQGDVERWRETAREADAYGQLTSMLDRQAALPQAATPAERLALPPARG